MSSELKIREESFEDAVKVYISGEVDIYTSQSLKDKLYEIVDSSKMDLKIDCSGLNYLDSTGLGIFVGTLKRAKQYNRKIYLLNIRENIKKLFTITGLDKVFSMEE